MPTRIREHHWIPIRIQIFMQGGRLAIAAFVRVLSMKPSGISVEVAGTEEIHSQIRIPLLPSEKIRRFGIGDCGCEIVGLENTGGVAFCEADESAVGVVVVGFLEVAAFVGDAADAAQAIVLIEDRRCGRDAHTP